MAFEAPSGLMGKPEDIDDFEAFAVHDLVFYIAKNLLQAELKDNSFYFYLEGYGKYKFDIL